MAMRNRSDLDGARRRVVFTEESRRNLARATLAGGAIAGVVAGVAMGIVAMVQSAWVGLGLWLPLQSIAGLFYGVGAFVGGAGAVLTGLLIHLAVSAGLGVVFASMVRPVTSAGTAFAGGLLYGGVIWALMTFVILPIFNPVMSARVAMTSGWWFFLHMIYGGTLAITPALVRSYATRAKPVEGGQAPTADRRAA